jgi:N-acetyl sugar amidotransferase
MRSANKICSRCVMDSTAAGIIFDHNGVCNYCKAYESARGTIDVASVTKNNHLEKLLLDIKSQGKGKRYDCIVGVSGGVDSSWVLVKAVEFGLRPLAVHMDNGWNSELAQQNIEQLVKKLNVDLFTHVLDWNEFRDLQESFFDADVIDLELLTDNFLVGLNYEQASKWKTKFILSGSNTVTEGIPMPSNWAAINKYDKKNILNIWRQKGKGYKFNTISVFSYNDFNYNWYIRKIKWHSFLDLLDYKKSSAVKRLSQDFGYVPYPYKHYESVFTRLYQGVILPRKFGVDKRKNHLSALVMDGDMNRDSALEMLNQLPYPSEAEMQSDIAYFLKKFNWTKDQFEAYLNRPEIPHLNYGGDTDLMAPLRKLKKILKG